MDCRLAQEWLPDAADPAVAAHLRTCPACQRFAAAAGGLERAWRDLPLPPDAEAAKAAFLARLPRRRPPLVVVLWRRLPLRRGLGGLLLLAVGLGLLALLPAPQAQAAPDLVDRLVEWNLAIAEADSPAERQRRYADQAAHLESELRAGPVPAADAELARALFTNGTWLAGNDDPLAAAERFTDLTDRAHARLTKAAGAQDPNLPRLLQRYHRLLQGGVQAHLDKSEADAPPERKGQLERLRRRDAERQQALAALLETTPEPTRKQIRQALDAVKKHPKAAGGEKPGKGKHKDKNAAPGAAAN
jgi:hypothetical protein